MDDARHEDVVPNAWINGNTTMLDTESYQQLLLDRDRWKAEHAVMTDRLAAALADNIPLTPLHTPGPWEAVRSLTCGHLRAAHNYQDNPREEWTDADLRLIAAAPRMLELIRELHGFLAPIRHRQYAEQGRRAFRDAAILLREHGG